MTNSNDFSARFVEKEFVDRQLATKGYGNVSEYFRSLLREAQAKEEDARLEALLLEGLADRRAFRLMATSGRDLCR